MTLGPTAEFITTHWVGIWAGLTTAYTVIVETFSRVSSALPAPTAESTPRYRFWFVFSNNLSRNPGRAQNLARIQDSPNFQPAADAYMKEKLNGYIIVKEKENHE